MFKRLNILLGAVLLAASLFGGEDWKPQPIGPFGTLNNRDNSFALAADKAQDLLNVDITPGGKSVKKRKGYGLAFSFSVSTSPLHSVYDFFNSNGNEISLSFCDTQMASSISGGALNVLFSTGPNGATYQCTDSLGSAYCANTSRTVVTKTDGSTYSNLTGYSSTGTMVATAVTRLAMAGFSDRPSGIDFSSDSDFTSWGTGSLGTSPVQLTVNAPGAKITHIVYAFGRLMWFKDTSFGYVLIGNQPFQSDWVIKTVSYDVGTNDNTSVYREGVLYFRGKDSHIYEFDGSNYQRASREISATILASQNRLANAWLQTSAADFGASSTTPQNYIDTTTVSGTVYLTTSVPISPFVDSISTQFAAGTLTNTSTVTANTVRLDFNPQSVLTSFYPGATDTCSDLCTAPYYQTQRIDGSLTLNTIASSVLMRLKKTGSPGNYRLDFMSDSSGAPGSILDSASIASSGIGTSVGDYIINFSSIAPLTAGTTYWLRFLPLSGTCDSTNKVEWNGTGIVGPGVIVYGCGSTLNTSGAGGLLYGYKLFTSSYQASGTFISQAFDTGFTTNTWVWNWGTFVPNIFIRNNTNITYETQTSSSATGIFESLIAVSSGNAPTSSSQEFIRYKATLVTSIGSTSPIINSITVNNGDRRRPSGTFYSQVFNAPRLTAWDSVNWTILNGIGSFYIRASTMNFSIGSSTPSWTAINNGAIPSISTGTFLQVRDDLNTSGLYSNNPTIYDFTVNWFEGAAADKAYAIYFDDKILWSVTSGTSATTNNRILIYDLLNQGWLIYDLASNGFYIRQNRLYFGSSTSGNIFKFGDIDNDNGSAINAYWKSKDFFGDNPFTTQEIANISVAAGEVANSSVTITCTLNGSTTTSFVMPLYATNNMFVNKNKNLAGGTIGSTYNIKFGNNAVDQPFEIFGVQVGIRPKTWVPTQ